ncbi:hypothetical protein AVEN_44019-1 [Araneus ventricosus]|uniref:Uncharacterized protein n=1 Tax=Araneus ventricosus TaxID=182803 RepID=A0A4Y2GJ90_ARAVE|nr:hypothetical protein AVEN_44019-1 [Araneus ventricosus]
MVSKKWKVPQSVPRFIFENTDPVKNESLQFETETFNIEIAPLLEETEAVLTRNELLPGKVASLSVETASSAPTLDLPVESGSCPNQTGSFCSQTEFSPDEAQ